MVEFYTSRHFFFYQCVKTKRKCRLNSKIKKQAHYEAKRKMTILSFFTLNIPIRRLWTNLYHKEDHFLKIWSLLHYFSDIYLKIYDFALFLKKKFLPTQKKKKCPQGYLEPSRKSIIKVFAKIVNSFQPLTIFATNFRRRCPTGF